MSFSCSSKFYLWIGDFPSFQDNDIILDFFTHMTAKQGLKTGSQYHADLKKIKSNAGVANLL